MLSLKAVSYVITCILRKKAAKFFAMIFRLVVYGITDIQGRLHPVAFMLTSTESEEDFVNFYVGLNNLKCKNINIDYNPRFIMQDHCL
jgi:hypothetical protein